MAKYARKKGRKTRSQARNEAEEKLHRFVSARTLKGRLNYGTDLVYDVLYPDPAKDELAHLGIELLLGRGNFVSRIGKW